MRTRAKVSYADFDPEQGPIHTFSDDDEFNPASEPDELDVDEEMDDAVPESDDGIKQEDEVNELIEVSPPPAKRPKSKTATKSEGLIDSKVVRLPKNVQEPSPTPKLDTAPPIPLQQSQEDRTVASTVASKREIPTAEKLGDRVRYIFGDNNDRLVKAVETRIEWGPPSLIPEESIALKTKQFGSDFEPQTRTTSPITCMLEQISPEVEFKGHSINVNDYTIEAGATRSTDNVVLLNAGSFVKSAKFAPFNETQLLAVAIIPSELDPLDVNASDPNLSAFGPANGESLIQFYDHENKPFALVSCGYHGPVVRMDWRPVSKSRELAVLFQDGQIAIIPTPDKGSYNAQLDSTIKLDTRITSFCWSTEDNVLLGTIDGYVAEFNLNDASAPLFYHPIHLSMIYDIAASFGSDLETFCTTSPDGDSLVTDKNDLSKRIPVARGRGFIPIVKYISLINSYVTQDDHVVSRLIFAHTPSVPSGTQLTLHTANLSAAATSLIHPFVLTGSTDGTVALVNASRRALTPKRSIKGEQSVLLWTLQVDERTKKYTMTDILKLSEYQAKTRAPSEIVMVPQTCTITSIDWYQSKEHASWYCAATSSGLIRLEKLD